VRWTFERNDRYRHLQLSDVLIRSDRCKAAAREDRDLGAPLFPRLTHARLRTAISDGSDGLEPATSGVTVLRVPVSGNAAAIAIAVTSSGAFRTFEMTVVITQRELLPALEKAADFAYVAPGAAVHA
jgi:hypothetical protein